MPVPTTNWTDSSINTTDWADSVVNDTNWGEKDYRTAYFLLTEESEYLLTEAGDFIVVYI